MSKGLWWFSFRAVSAALLLVPVQAVEQTAQAQERPATQVTIRADNFTFIADEISVPAGEVKITLVNESWFIPHALAFEGGIAERIERVGGGQSAEMVIPVTTPGRYTFFCPLWGHRFLGMVGTLIIKPRR